MRSIGRLVGLAAVGLLVLLAGSMAHEGEDHGEEEYCEAEGIGCPLPGDHDHHRYVRVLGEEDEHDHEHMDYHITLSSDRPRGVRLGKVVGFRMRIPDINDWHWHDEYDNDVEEVLVGFIFGGHEHEHRQLQEHEHSDFMFRNYNVKPKMSPKKYNRAHLDMEEGVVDWHLEPDMTYKRAHTFLMFGTVSKEYPEKLLEVVGFMKNATGCMCWEEHIKVAVLRPKKRPLQVHNH